MTHIIFWLLVSGALVVSFGAIRARMHVLNVRAAWRYRERLAEIAHQIESDADAPAEAKRYVGYLANFAFDRKFFRSLRTGSAVQTNTKPSQKKTREALRKQFGPKYGALLFDALVSLVFISLLCDSNMGWAIRLADHHGVNPYNLKDKDKKKARLAYAHQEAVEHTQFDDHATA